MDIRIADDELKDDLIERFTRYVKINTTSDRHSKTFPTTKHQFDLARLLEKELKELGLDDVNVDENAFLIARIPSTIDIDGTIIGLMAHIDTASDVSGKNVHPVLHENYDGKTIKLNGTITLDPKEFPALKNYRGDTVITADGTTLLGADDKAGVAEIMTAVFYLTEHPEIPHGELEIIFTPDEETGLGMSNFPLKKVKSEYCYTIDGAVEGSVEIESINSHKRVLTFLG